MRTTTYRRRLAISVLRSTPRRLSRQLVDPPSSLRCRAPLQWKTALAEANSFPFCCQPFCRIPTRVVQCPADRVRGAVRATSRLCETKSGNVIGGLGGARPGALLQARFDQAKPRQYPQTVARKSAIRLRPEHVSGTAPASGSKTTSGRPQTSSRQTSDERPDGMRDTTRRTSWPRASGPSSRTTGAEPACTGSVCACAPVRDARLCRVGVARDAAPSLPDRSTRFSGGAARTQPHEAVNGVCRDDETWDALQATRSRRACPAR